MTRTTRRAWLSSAPWIAAAVATPWASRAASPVDPTVITLLAAFAAVGVLGIPLGVLLGRLGVRREAVAVAALAVAGAAASCAVRIVGVSDESPAGKAAIVLVPAALFAALALPLPAVGFVVAWVRWKPAH
ncbi:hypothetical protein [Streptomyces sp. CBMA29]|uniref:hypothetical protein n=1 Tax=Streptomyces sp. CBMA29 TaxID=1896314 RepID=UPI001661E150|nr:hypothetical protein [Streptomyces sp. CBMA29]